MGETKSRGLKLAEAGTWRRFYSAKSRPWIVASATTIAALVLGSNVAEGKIGPGKSSPTGRLRAVKAGGLVSPLFGNIHNFATTIHQPNGIEAKLPVSGVATTLAVYDIDGAAGTNVRLGAVLVQTNGGGCLPGQTVDFRVDGTLVGSDTTDSAGEATLNWTVPIGTVLGAHTITAEFAGDAVYESTSGHGTLTVKILPTASIPSLATTYLAKTTMRGTLKANGFAIAGRLLEFRVDGTAYIATPSATTASNGVATIVPVVTQRVGTYALTVFFAGDGTYAPTESAVSTITIGKGNTLIVPAPATAKFGGNATLKATLKVGTTPIPNETVDFKVNGVSVGTAFTNTAGVATKTVKILDNVGTHALAATFAATDDLKTASAGTTLKVSAATTKVVGEILKKTAGSVVAFGATLTRTTDSTVLEGKTLTFIDAATSAVLGTGTTDANGKATINVTVPAKGAKRTITVKFATDGNHAAATGSGSVTGQ